VMRLLLTGSTGLVGRNLLEHPKAKDFEILAPSRAELNLLDSSAVRAFFAAKKVDAVIHAAGLVGGIQANIASPVRFLVENTEMGRNVILGAFDSGVRQLVNLGSSCIYPRNRSGKLTEEMLLDGKLEPTNEGYALAKIFAAKLCQYLRRENPGLQYKTLLPCNLYGRWDHFNEGDRSHLIAAIFNKIEVAKQQHSDEVSIWGTGRVRREFMYAAEAADAIFWALENLERLPDLLNVGTGQDYTVTEYYEAVAKVLGFSGRFTYDTSKPEGMTRKLLDISKIEALGWSCRTALEEGIRKTYEFNRNQSHHSVSAR
jgi:GDP-L-fucose synthase